MERHRAGQRRSAGPTPGSTKTPEAADHLGRDSVGRLGVQTQMPGRSCQKNCTSIPPVWRRVDEALDPARAVRDAFALAERADAARGAGGDGRLPVRHLEGDVVDRRAAALEEALNERGVAERLDDLPAHLARAGLHHLGHELAAGVVGAVEALHPEDAPVPARQLVAVPVRVRDVVDGDDPEGALARRRCAHARHRAVDAAEPELEAVPAAPRVDQDLFHRLLGCALLLAPRLDAERAQVVDRGGQVADVQQDVVEARPQRSVDEALEVRVGTRRRGDLPVDVGHTGHRHHRPLDAERVVARALRGREAEQPLQQLDLRLELR